MKAVEDGWTSVGIQVKEGVVLAAEKKLQSKLQISRNNEKIVNIDRAVIGTHSGLLSDARALIEKARVEAANHWFSYEESIPVESLASAVANSTMSFAEKDKKKDNEEEERRVSRPFGCSLLIAGVEDNQAYLFRNGVNLKRSKRKLHQIQSSRHRIRRRKRHDHSE